MKIEIGKIYRHKETGDFVKVTRLDSDYDVWYMCQICERHCYHHNTFENLFEETEFQIDTVWQNSDERKAFKALWKPNGLNFIRLSDGKEFHASALDLNLFTKYQSWANAVGVAIKEPEPTKEEQEDELIEIARKLIEIQKLKAEIPILEERLNSLHFDLKHGDFVVDEHLFEIGNGIDEYIHIKPIKILS